jgi:hypothetical protein
MKILSSVSIRNFIISASIATALFGAPAMAESGSVHHSGQASKHVVLAVAHGAESGVKVASAVAAAPIVLAGGLSVAAGSAAISVGESIANSSQRVSVHTHLPEQGPLDITERVITADPAPNQVSQTVTVTSTQTHETVNKTTHNKAQR